MLYRGCLHFVTRGCKSRSTGRVPDVTCEVLSGRCSRGRRRSMVCSAVGVTWALTSDLRSVVC